jgi:Gpi18-like mannosyltransferase
MPAAAPSSRVAGTSKPNTIPDWSLLLLSVVLQLALGLVFGHLYDTRIFMATGYLVGSGQNPYIAQDLTAVFNNSSFQGMTSVGYPPPWPIVLGLIYRGVYALIPNLLVCNLAIKLPVIAANIGLAYLVANILKNLGSDAATCRRAWVWMLLNPLLLYFASAWGQIDSIVAVLALASLVLLHREKPALSAVVLALALSFKPTPLPLVAVSLAYLAGQSVSQMIRYSALFLGSVLLFCVAPFVVLGWSPAPIVHGWNAHFAVGGGLSVMSFFEFLYDTYQLSGNWWLLGLAWMPALAIGMLALRPGVHGFVDLLKKSTALILVFFLTRAWLSEPNVILILPFVLILTSVGALDRLALAAVCIVPLAFTVLNASPPQLLFPTFPEVMERLLRLADGFRSVRLIARTALVVPWQIVGWWIVVTCFRRSESAPGGSQRGLQPWR